MRIISTVSPRANLTAHEIAMLKAEIDQLKETLVLTQRQLADLLPKPVPTPVSDTPVVAVSEPAVAASTPRDPLFAQLWGYINSK